MYAHQHKTRKQTSADRTKHLTQSHQDKHKADRRLEDEMIVWRRQDDLTYLTSPLLSPVQGLHHLCQQQVRLRSRLPLNTAILFVPQQEAWIIERFGKYHRVLEPGLNLCIPVVDSIKYVQSLKEIAIDVPQQAAISVDNVTLTMDGILYLRVMDPYKASYGVEDPEYAITQLAQTTMRSEIGKITLDNVFRERESLNIAIVGIREAEINIAEGKKQARILNSEAFKAEQINQAHGDAEALIARARAKASSVDVVAKALSQKNGLNAVGMNVAEQYVAAFGQLAKTTNTLIVPSNTGDVSSMVAQAMTIYTSLADRNTHLQGSELSNKSRSDSDSGCQQLDAAGDSTSNYVEKDLSKDAHQPSDHRDQH
ncbi:hypothetical protein C0Q70_19707 [Pomacea canaliculata]|uniref:Band 7 domain-containing protein n=1 Tax=Pomacea canaliculata TaxID=400727 RepID=A0A2T7NDK2_POMCA|nr:hypothetical protein C0Q70_19707 [Pomacea canaliculata]